jgi:hypothetical protein
MGDKRWKATERKIAAMRRDDQPDVAPQTGQQEPPHPRRLSGRKGEEIGWDELDEADQAILRAAGQGPRDTDPGRLR